MDINKNYYSILGVSHESSVSDIKKIYYKLSFLHHPDQNKNSDPSIFPLITEAYDVLCGESRKIYDKKSKFGKDYTEIEELFDINIYFDYELNKAKYEKFKKNEVLDIYEEVDDTFNGKIKYQRLVMCKSCEGTGKDFKSKMVIKDEFGNVKGIFDSEDGCDFCDGTGKNHLGDKCGFCFGCGKVGSKECSVCLGEKRILGNQTLSKIILDRTKKETIIPHMGNFSKNHPGKVGSLILIYLPQNDLPGESPETASPPSPPSGDID